jgi:nitroreductase
VLAEDVRALTGRQEFPATAPLNLVYVMDRARMTTTRFEVSDEDRRTWAAVKAGAIAQNVYLFCASEGLNTVVRALIPRTELAAKLSLRPTQEILLAQTIGHPLP